MMNDDLLDRVSEHFSALRALEAAAGRLERDHYSLVRWCSSQFVADDALPTEMPAELQRLLTRCADDIRETRSQIDEATAAAQRLLIALSQRQGPAGERRTGDGLDS